VVMALAVVVVLEEAVKTSGLRSKMWILGAENPHGGARAGTSAVVTRRRLYLDWFAIYYRQPVLKPARSRSNKHERFWVFDSRSADIQSVRALRHLVEECATI